MQLPALQATLPSKFFLSSQNVLCPNIISFRAERTLKESNIKVAPPPCSRSDMGTHFLPPPTISTTQKRQSDNSQAPSPSKGDTGSDNDNKEMTTMATVIKAITTVAPTATTTITTKMLMTMTQLMMTMVTMTWTSTMMKTLTTITPRATRAVRLKVMMPTTTRSTMPSKMRILTTTTILLLPLLGESNQLNILSIYIILSELVDIHMHSPDSNSKQLQGTSHTSGGTSHGHAHWNVFNFADVTEVLKEDPGPGITLKGEVYIYTSSSNLMSLNPKSMKPMNPESMKPMAMVKVTTSSTIAPILQQVTHLFAVNILHYMLEYWRTVWKPGAPCSKVVAKHTI